MRTFLEKQSVPGSWMGDRVIIDQLRLKGLVRKSITMTGTRARLRLFTIVFQVLPGCLAFLWTKKKTTRTSLTARGETKSLKLSGNRLNYPLFSLKVLANNLFSLRNIALREINSNSNRKRARIQEAEPDEDYSDKRMYNKMFVLQLGTHIQTTRKHWQAFSSFCMIISGADVIVSRSSSRSTHFLPTTSSTSLPLCTIHTTLMNLIHLACALSIYACSNWLFILLLQSFSATSTLRCITI
jgi:hypothetical protein